MQRTYLETVLTHLSSGVLSFDQRNCLRTHNAAAAQILRMDLGPAEGKISALAFEVAAADCRFLPRNSRCE